MLLTRQEYGCTIEQVAQHIKGYALFPLSLEEVKKQVYLVPYLAIGKNPEAVIAIGKNTIYTGESSTFPNKNITQYKDFIILSKKEMLEVCTMYIKLIDQEKKEYLRNVDKRTK